MYIAAVEDLTTRQLLLPPLSAGVSPQWFHSEWKMCTLLESAANALPGNMQLLIRPD